jgi:hypothetical protein
MPQCTPNQNNGKKIKKDHIRICFPKIKTVLIKIMKPESWPQKRWYSNL